jgi:EmrB/QacA subfamily drug resistance transporter
MAKTKGKETNHWLILVILALAQFMVVLDVSIVNVMLPTVQHAFHISETSLSWVVTAYTLAFGGFLMLGGRAADLFGRRRVFLTGVTAFAIVSLLDGLSQSGGMLISLRAVQGLCGAFMSPAALSIVLVTYREGHERNVALSVWGAVASGGAAFGLLIGGFLTQYLGWRWNFFINVPVGLFVVVMAYRLVPKHEGEEKDNSLDLVGAVSITAALMSLVYALVKAPTIGWTNHTTLTYLGIAAALLALFVFNESRVKHPIVPLSIFKIRNVVGADLTQLSIAAALFSVFFFSSLYLQEFLKYSPSRTGLGFLPVPFAIALTATNAPRFIKKFGAKRVLITGPLVAAVGLLMLSRITVNGGYFEHIMPGMIVMGLGLGLTFVSALVTATTGIAQHLSGLASGLINTAQQVGGSLGLAVITGVVASTAARYVTHHATSAHPTKLLVAQANVHSFQVGYMVGACFAVFGALIALIVIKHTKPTDVKLEDLAAH